MKLDWLRVVVTSTTLLGVAAPALARPAPPPLPGENAETAARMRGARFSGKRLALEIVVGGVVGSLVAYGTYKSACGDEPCIGGALGGWFANFAVTPLVVYGTGTLAGGEGRLAHAYYGAVPALAPFSATNAPVGLQFALSSLFLPITSSLMYELSSHVASVSWAREHQPQLTVRALGDGYAGTLSVRF